jgi:RNA polymerase sigma-70 factor (ECF subfamily)
MPADPDRERRDIEASRRGDSAAYARLIEAHQAGVASRMRRFAHDAGTVEELVQEVFVEAYFGLDRYEERAPFDHWLARIATRVGYRYWKRRQRNATLWQPLPDGVDLAADPSGAVEANEAAVTLRTVLDGLGPRDRLVVTLLYLEQHSVAEVAELTGWSRTMVKVQAFRARRKLRARLDAEGA